MRYLFIGYCLCASFLTAPCFSQQSNGNGFNTKSEETEKPHAESKAKSGEYESERNGFDELKEKFQQHMDEGRKAKEEFRKKIDRDKEELQHTLEKKRQTFEKNKQEFDQSIEEFHESFQTEKKKLESNFDKKREEFDQLRQQFLEKQKPEKEEVPEVKGIVFSHYQQNEIKQFLEDITHSGHCCSFVDVEKMQIPQVLVLMSFSIPDTAWISLSKELEKMGGVFVLRGLPEQSFQLLASRILKLKEQGVNAPIQIDPKSFLDYEINQVPTIVVVEEKIFDKVSGHVSLKFALEKMAQQGETKTASKMYQGLKDQI